MTSLGAGATVRRRYRVSAFRPCYGGVALIVPGIRFTGGGRLEKIDEVASSMRFRGPARVVD